MHCPKSHLQGTAYREPIRFIADTNVKENNETVHFFAHLVPFFRPDCWAHS
jgi:hypothetical protein